MVIQSRSTTTMATQSRSIALTFALIWLQCPNMEALEAVIPPHTNIGDVVEIVTAPQLSHLRGNMHNNSRVLQGNSPQYSQSEIAFFNRCNSELLSASVLADGIISQREYANGFVEFCNLYTAPASANPNFLCPENQFSALSMPLQLLFSEVVCGGEDDTMPARMKCHDALYSLDMVGADFGYIVTPEKMADVQMGVENLCLKLLDHVFVSDQYVTGPTVSPTSPTPAPATPAPATPSPVDTASPLSLPPATETHVETELNASGESISEDSKDGETEPDEGVLDLTVAGGTPEIIDNVVAEPPEDNELGTGPIIGIAAAAVACLFLFLLLAGRRRKVGNEEEEEDPAICNKSFQASGKNRIMNSAVNPRDSMQFPTLALPSSDDSNSLHSESNSGSLLVENVVKAIDVADWDAVYRLASQLAEEEDITTVSSIEKYCTRRFHPAPNLAFRSLLPQEDIERAKTLDKLVDNSDWTGVAVTAALYAGESGVPKQTFSQRSLSDIVVGKSETRGSYRSMTEEAAQNDNHARYSSGSEGSIPSQTNDDDASSLVELRERGDTAVGLGDWEKVATLSSEIENNTVYLSRPDEPTLGKNKYSSRTLKAKLDQAVKNSDWGAVSLYSSRIQQQSSSAQDTANPDLESAYGSSLDETGEDKSQNSFQHAGSSDSDEAKRQTISKLVKAGKYKGVQIMAGLYRMESKNLTFEDDYETQIRGLDPPSTSIQPSVKHQDRLVPHLDKSKTDNKKKANQSGPQI